jgi:hypothetical protein
MDKDSANKNFLHCIEEFGFEKVNKVMNFLNWEWAMIGVPDREKMIDVCMGLFRECLADIQDAQWVRCGTGGFYITLYQDDGIVIEFALENISYETSDW